MTIFIAFLLSCTLSARTQLTPADKKEVEAVLVLNETLFQALLKKDGKEVEKRSMELSKAVKASPFNWGEVKKKTAALDGMKASLDNDKHLLAYEQFLNPLMAVVKAHAVDARYQIFHCPMVKKSWIQDVKVTPSVRNVFATYMLECGEQTSRY